MRWVILFVFIFLSGCNEKSVFATLSEKNHQEAKLLADKLHIKKDDTVIVTTLADINNLDKSSQLGRALSEQIAKVFVNKGIKVKEIRFGKSIYTKKRNGEFVLSRDVKKIANKIKVDYVVVGTYAKGKDYIYVNIKVVNPKNDIIISSVDYTVDYSSLVYDF
ncbi:MAG: hypothetical protein GXO62_01450 [Epsilonproteobacteria bacterium]|nr:hypothetical protein [Campylobacterota bacterium]